MNTHKRPRNAKSLLAAAVASTLIVAGGVALAPAANAYLAPVDRKVASVCPYCGVGCQLTYHVHGNTIQRVEGRDGPANHERLCVKGRFGFDYVAHPHRLTKPLIRREDAPKSADSA